MQNVPHADPAHHTVAFEKIIHNRDGVRLATIDTGPRASSNPALLMLHGWSCDGSTLHRQLTHFRDERRVLIPDFRGHGDSDAPQQDYTVSGFVDDLIWQLDALGVPDAIVIGHSMGGIVGLELAARVPDRISGLFMIDSALLPPPELRAGLAGMGDLLATAGLRAALEQAAGLVFAPYDAAAIRTDILRMMAKTPDHVALSSFRGHLLDYDATAALSACQMPLGYVAAATSVADLARVRSECPQLLIAQTFGSGHFSPIFVPDQVNAMIERFIALGEAIPGSV